MRHYHLYAFLRILKAGFINSFRNLWLTIAATAVMIVTLTTISVGVVLNVTASNAINVLSQDLKTSIILKEDITLKQRKVLEKRLHDLDFVTTVEYISPATAQKRLSENPIIGSEALQASSLFDGEDFLAPSYEVALKDLSRSNELANLAEDPELKPFITRISLGKTDTGKKTDAEKAIERAASIEKFVTIGSVLSAAILAAVSTMIIFNTIRMAIYTRRDEISIMKLIGATPNYIRGPFLVEAGLYGIVAGIVTNFLIYSLIYTVGAKVAEAPEFIETYNYFTDPTTVTLMLLSSVLVGVLIGVMSSMLAMERHLKLKNW